MDSVSADDIGEEMAMTLHAEHRLGQLAPGVGLVDVVAFRHGEILEVQFALEVGVRHDVDDAAGRALLQLLLQQQGQIEVSKMVDAETTFNAVIGGGFRTHVACNEDVTTSVT